LKITTCGNADTVVSGFQTCIPDGQAYGETGMNEKAGILLLWAEHAQITKINKSLDLK